MNQPYQLQKNKKIVLLKLLNTFFHTYLDNIDKSKNEFQFLVLKHF